MKEVLLKINGFVTFILAVVVSLCLACAIEGQSPIQEWVRYAGMALAGEIVIWIITGIACVVNHFVNLPPMRRGYITYDERYGWTDEWGNRP